MNNRLYHLIPRHLLSAVMYYLARIQISWIKNAIIYSYMKITGANTEFAAEKNPYAYRSLNDFFTRALADNARPIDLNNHHIVSPVDGRCAQFGMLKSTTLLQAKGITYSAATLLGSQSWADYFFNGSTVTLYLAPDDYHRIHMPCDGSLQAMRFCPGDKHSVSLSLLDKIPNIFSGNERAVCLFDTPYGKMALVFVGALNVSSIETVWHGNITDNKQDNLYDYTKMSHHYHKGEEIGRFNLGSTVILFFENNILSWKTETLTRAEKIRMGEVIAETL